MFSTAAFDHRGSSVNWIGVDLHRSRLAIVRGTLLQEDLVHKDGDEIRADRQRWQTWDAENTSSVGRWEQIVVRISGDIRTVARNEFTRCFAWRRTQ